MIFPMNRPGKVIQPVVYCAQTAKFLQSRMQKKDNQENLLSKIAEPNPIFYKDSESRAQRQIYLAPVPETTRYANTL